MSNKIQAGIWRLQTRLLKKAALQGAVYVGFAKRNLGILMSHDIGRNNPLQV